MIRPTDYIECRRDLVALLAEEPDQIARMASVAAVLYERMDDVSFCGFYRVIEKNLLVIGPYQGPVGCLRIAFGRGVCGAAAAEKRSLLVPDVHRFPGHIACDPHSRSELVVPVLGPGGELLAILDLDSRTASRFSDTDREELEMLMARIFA
jgi:GAF domain-containing protein